MYDLYNQFLDDNSDKPGALLFTVTLIDDDKLFIEQMKDYLNSMKITQVESFSSGEEFLSIYKQTDRRLVVCDFDFGSAGLMNGLQVLEEIKKRNPEQPVIMLSAQDNLAIALNVLRNGASDYFIKGTENTFTSVLTSIIKINELQRLKKNESDYMRVIVAGSILIAALLIFLFLQFIN